jgi:3'-5' exoribonuclease
MKKQFIEDLHPGDDVDEVFYVFDKETRKTRDGKDFIVFNLTDRTGSLKALLFEPGPKLMPAKGSFVRVQGKLTEYNGRVNIKIEDLWQEKESSVDYSDFLPKSERDVEKCYSGLKRAARELSEPLRALLTAFFDNPNFERQFKLAPAGVRAHHAYIGGLCIHTYDMLVLAEAVAASDSELDKEILIAGVLLHDIGKIREYEYSKSIDNTDEGKLLGHIAIGIRMIEREIQRIQGFPEKLAWKLLHMVVSHHGFKEYGSPRPPLFLEAQILHQIDNLDSKRAMYREVADRREEGNWSEYHPYLEHDTYLDRSAE